MNHKESLLSYMQQGALIITPNNRLSHQLLNDYAQSIQKKHEVISKPRCLPYQSFLTDWFQRIRHHDAHTHHPILLSDIQQQHLWRQILTQHSQYPCNDGLLQDIQQAWKRCHYWHIDMESAEFLATPQTRQFQAWQRLFQSKLSNLGAITQEQLVPYLCQFSIELTQKIIWVCFDDYTPQQQALQAFLSTQPIEQYHEDLQEMTSMSFQYPAAHQYDEYEQMLAWVNARLSQGEQRIAIVVPDLQIEGSNLARFFRRHLKDHQYNISLGKTLIDFPIVAHALHGLSLDTTVMSHHKALLLLHSPYLAGSQTEFLARAELSQSRDELRESQIAFSTLIDVSKKKAPILSNVLSTLVDYPASASVGDWVHHFKHRLNQLGFPGDSSLNSANYQCVQRFIALLDEFLQCALITPTMTRSEAINTLYQLAKTAIFQLKQPNTPVVVLGLLEVSGCTFDSLWFSGLTDQCLPHKINLSAFIPFNIQKTAHMPHASFERELSLSKRLLNRLQNAAKNLIFSYPTWMGDLPTLVSPLIAHLPVHQPIDRTPNSTCGLILFEEDYIIPLRATEKVIGGTALLSNQAKCPFRALTAHRLHVNTNQSQISDGPDAILRGKIIHKVLELFWQEVVTQKRLQTMSDATLIQQLKETISEALQPIVSQKNFSFPLVAQEVEFTRLEKLLVALLSWEKQRDPFNVEMVERSFTINLAGIDFQIRVDRLDQLLSNNIESLPLNVVIDYKSSLPSTKPWQEDRPEAPQLLLYALLDENIKALVFIELKSGRIRVQGLSEQTISIDGVQPLKENETWSAYRNEWHMQLTQLAEEFKMGHCPPSPQKASTCLQCSFNDLCRKGFF